MSENVLKNDLSKKKKDIAWIVSHCETDSKREAFVEKLQNLTSLQIDIYGKCGKQGLNLSVRPVEAMYGELYLSLNKSQKQAFVIITVLLIYCRYASGQPDVNLYFQFESLQVLLVF